MSTSKSKRRAAKKRGAAPVNIKAPFPVADAMAVTAWSASLYAAASPPLVRNEGLKALAIQFGLEVPKRLR